MNKKPVVFGVILAAGMAVAVSGLVAQAPAPGDERPRARVLRLDGRGGQLGVMVNDLTADELKALGSATGGVRIEDVDQDGPAAKAGLLEGDIVVDVDGDRVRGARQFSRMIQETPEGRSVTLGVVRNGKRQTISVTPEARAFGFGLDGDRIGRDIARGLQDLEPRLRELEPKLREIEPRLREFRFGGPMDFNFDFAPGWASPRGRLGVQLGELTPQLADYFGARDGGVLVSSVNSDSPAEKAGLKAGDVITSLNGGAVRDSDDLIDGLRDVEGQDVTIGILRDKKESSVKATLESRPRPVWRRPA
jgi:S1-C subfamily serine protease